MMEMTNGGNVRVEELPGGPVPYIRGGWRNDAKFSLRNEGRKLEEVSMRKQFLVSAAAPQEACAAIASKARLLVEEMEKRTQKRKILPLVEKALNLVAEILAEKRTADVTVLGGGNLSRKKNLPYTPPKTSRLTIWAIRIKNNYIFDITALRTQAPRPFPMTPQFIIGKLSREARQFLLCTYISPHSAEKLMKERWERKKKQAFERLSCYNIPLIKKSEEIQELKVYGGIVALTFKNIEYILLLGTPMGWFGVERRRQALPPHPLEGLRLLGIKTPKKAPRNASVSWLWEKVREQIVLRVLSGALTVLDKDLEAANWHVRLRDAIVPLKNAVMPTYSK